jgi:phosphopantetheinyl transferase
MPLVYQQDINAYTKLGLWHITEAEEFFIGLVPLQNSITHPHKRLQHLAGRVLLTELFPDFPLLLIRIADTKKPYLQDEAYHFSISHCGDYAAAIVSKNERVGVDVEVPREKIEMITHKYLNDFEKETICLLPGSFVDMLTLAWSIKETLFKWNGAPNIDFKAHMQILNCYESQGRFTADCVFLKEEKIELKVHGLFVNGNCLTWLHTASSTIE